MQPNCIVSLQLHNLAVVFDFQGLQVCKFNLDSFLCLPINPESYSTRSNPKNAKTSSAFRVNESLMPRQ